MPAIVLADAGAFAFLSDTETVKSPFSPDPTPLRAGPVDVSILVQEPLRAGQSWMT